jgi:hypothetical protein
MYPTPEIATDGQSDCAVANQNAELDISVQARYPGFIRENVVAKTRIATTMASRESAA